TTVNAVNGVATFSTLSINNAGSGYNLVATAAGLTSATSAPFTVTTAAIASVRVETAANGTGAVITSQQITSGNSITAYAIGRDSSGNFVSNLAATWSLTSVTGGVAAGDLVPAGNNLSAVFTAHLSGSANINASAGGLNGSSGTLTVIGGAAAKLAFIQSP